MAEIAEPKSKTPLAESLLSNDSKPKVAAAPKASSAPKLTEPKAAGVEGAGGKKKHKHTHIEHHDNGTHTTRHTPVGGGEETSYASQDLDGVHDGLEQHVGEPNGDEAQPQMAGGGAPEPGGAPAPGGAPQPGAGAPPQVG
jgi:hypothetical protein